MSNLFSAIDPLYMADFSMMINSNTSTSSLKAFSAQVKALSNASFIPSLNDEDDLFGDALGFNSQDVYMDLFNYSNAYPSKLSTSLFSSNETKMPNVYQSEYENALKDLYEASNVKLSNNTFLNIINDKNFCSEINLDEGKIFIDKSFSNDNPIIMYMLNDSDEIKKVDMRSFNLNNATQSEMSCYLAYNLMNEENEFPESLKDLISFSDSYTKDNESNYEKIISFISNYKKYKTVSDKYNEAQKEADKINEESERLEALFDLIDSINKMYQDYSKKKRENYYK